MRTMYDGVNTDAAAIGAAAKPGDLVGGYVDGLYEWSAADWDRLAPGVIRVRIAVLASTNDGHVLDCEPGNCTPAQAVDWVLMRRRAGVDPSVYCNQMNPDTGWPAVRAAFQARGVPQPHYWVAKYDNVASIPVGAVGKQYADGLALGQPWDISIVADHWPGVDTAPAPDPAPKPKESDMILLTGFNGPAVAALSGGLLWDVQDGASVDAYKAAGVQVATITAKEHAALLAAVAAQQPVATGSIPVTLSGSGSITVAAS